MPKPLAICLEDPGARSAAERYLRCTAVVGRQAGLRVDGAGTVLWRSDEAVACELWVSLDDKLILYRPEGAAAVAVHRAGRVLDVPAGKPVVLVDQDEFQVGAKRLRVHVHGTAPAAYMRASAGRVCGSLLATQSSSRKTVCPRSTSESTDCSTQTSVSVPATRTLARRVSPARSAGGCGSAMCGVPWRSTMAPSAPNTIESIRSPA